MAELNDKFWDIVAKDGPVPFNQLDEFVEKALKNNPEFSQLPTNADTTVLYSGSLTENGYVSSTEAAQDLAQRGHGTIGIIDDTPTGKALGQLFDDLKSPELIEKYSDYIDFSKSNMDHADYLKKLADPAFTTETRAFSGNVYNAFDPSSTAFASKSSGNIITLTPNASDGGAFRRLEVPEIVKRLESGHIDSVNGVQRADILKNLENLQGKARLDKAFSSFNQSYADNIKRLDIDVYKGEKTVNGEVKSVTVIDADQSQLSELGAGDSAKIDPPNLKGLTPQNINSPGRSTDGPDRNNGPGGAASTPETSTPERSPSADSDGLRPAAALDDAAISDGRARLLAADELGELRGFAASPDGSVSHLIDTKTSTIYTPVSYTHLTLPTKA